MIHTIISIKSFIKLYQTAIYHINPKKKVYNTDQNNTN